MFQMTIKMNFLVIIGIAILLYLFFAKFFETNQYMCFDNTGDQIAINFSGEHSFILSKQHGVAKNAVTFKSKLYENSVGISADNLKIILWPDNLHGLLFYKSDAAEGYSIVPILCTKANFNKLTEENNRFGIF